MEYQTRNESGDIKVFDTLGAAFAHAEQDPTVWKVSFSLPSGERIRLVKEWTWSLRDIRDYVD